MADKLKCGCGNPSMLMEVPTELVETVGEIMAENMAEEQVLDNQDDSNDQADDNKAKSAEVAEEENTEGKVESVFTRRTEAVKQKSAEHKDVDDYLATLVATEVISSEEVAAHRGVFVALKSAGDDNAIETYMNTLEAGKKLKSASSNPKAIVHKQSLPKTKEKAATSVSGYEAEVTSLAAALENLNSFTQ